MFEETEEEDVIDSTEAPSSEGGGDGGPDEGKARKDCDERFEKTRAKIKEVVEEAEEELKELAEEAREKLGDFDEKLREGVETLRQKLAEFLDSEPEATVLDPDEADDPDYTTEDEDSPEKE